MRDRAGEGGPDFDPDRFIDAAAALAGLVITPEQRPGVKRFLAAAQRMAAIVAAAPIGTEASELAPVFTPGERRLNGS